MADRTNLPPEVAALSLALSLSTGCGQRCGKRRGRPEQRGFQASRRAAGGRRDGVPLGLERGVDPTGQGPAQRRCQRRAPLDDDGRRADLAHHRAIRVSRSTGRRMGRLDAGGANALELVGHQLGQALAAPSG